MSDISGSIRKVSLAGQSFRVAADVNVKSNLSSEKEAIATNAGNMIKVTLKAATKEGLSLICNPGEYQNLKALHKQNTPFTMAVTLADGTTMIADGSINVESYESQDNKATVVLIPATDWSDFVAK